MKQLVIRAGSHLVYVLGGQRDYQHQQVQGPFPPWSISDALSS